MWCHVMSCHVNTDCQKLARFFFQTQTARTLHWVISIFMMEQNNTRPNVPLEGTPGVTPPPVDESGFTSIKIDAHKQIITHVQANRAVRIHAIVAFLLSCINFVLWFFIGWGTNVSEKLRAKKIPLLSIKIEICGKNWNISVFFVFKTRAELKKQNKKWFLKQKTLLHRTICMFSFVVEVNCAFSSIKKVYPWWIFVMAGFGISMTIHVFVISPEKDWLQLHINFFAIINMLMFCIWIFADSFGWENSKK